MGDIPRRITVGAVAFLLLSMGIASARSAPAGSVTAPKPPLPISAFSPPPSAFAFGGVLPALHVQGTRLVDATGKTIKLRGVDLGGWLVPEGWMCGMNGASRDDVVFRWAIEDLEQRFGTREAATLMNAWLDRWITTTDLDQIRALGYNAVRVPFSWRNLQNEQGRWNTDASGNIDFSRLDWIVTQAGARGIYVVLDFHIWQGQRAHYATINSAGPKGDAQRSAGVAIWQRVAGHFKGNTNIAGFDVINEPDLSGGSPGDLPQHAFFQAIRSVDPTRVTIIESNSISDMSDFPNSMWSDHYPNGGWNNGGGWNPSNFHGPGQTGSGIAPVYIGEFHADNGAAPKVGQSLDQSGVSWMSWAWKTVNQGDWGVYQYGNSATVDIMSASADQILSVWRKNLDLSQAQPQSGLLNGYSAAAKAPRP